MKIPEEMTHEDRIEAKDLVLGLRMLAKFIEDHPQTAEDLSYVRVSASVWGDDEEVLAEMGEWARLFGHCEKKYNERYFTLLRKFSECVQVEIYAAREKVCTKRVIGTTTEQRYTLSPEDQAKVDAMKHEYRDVEVEVVEWDCPPSLLG